MESSHRTAGRQRMRAPWHVSAVVAAVVLAGGSAQSAGASTPAVTSLLMPPKAMPGFTIVSSRTLTAVGPAEAAQTLLGVSGKAGVDAANSLRSEGFQFGGTEETLGPRRHGAEGGGSEVLVFATHGGSEREASRDFHRGLKEQPKDVTINSLSVDLPEKGASVHAYTASGTAGDPGFTTNVFVALGRCTIFVGDFTNTDTDISAPVVKAVQTTAKQDRRFCG